MYCRNCGKEVPEKAEVCLGCGVRPLNGEKFCWNCAAESAANQEFCLKCGVRLKRSNEGKLFGGEPIIFDP